MDKLTISNDAVAITLANAKDVQIKIASSDAVAEEVIVDEVALKGGSIDGGYVEPGYEEGTFTEDGMYAETGMAEIKDPLLSSWPFVIGISAAVLFVSVALGAFLAKRKIKKGIELYED